MKRRLLHIFTTVFSLVFAVAFANLNNIFADDLEKSDVLKDWIIYTYDNTSGLPTGEANTVLQTSDGYVWIGSYGGLIRFDGISFHNYSEGGVFPSSAIRALYEDSKGRLWIGTNDMGVFYYENGEFVHIAYSDKSKFLSIRCFEEGKDGIMYVGATSGLATVTKENTLKNVDEVMCCTTVYSMATDNAGITWACMDDGIALQVSGGEIKGSFDSSNQLKAPIYCAGADNEGNLYLGTSKNYIYKVEVADSSHTDVSYNFTELDTENISTINNIARDAEGRIWIAGLNGIGYFETDMSWNQIDDDRTYSAGTICFDYEGNVWASSSSMGVIHLVKGLFKNFNTAAGISKVSVNDVTVFDAGYYISTDTGLIILDKHFNVRKTNLSEKVQGDRVRHVMCDSNNNIWVGTYYQNGLLKYSPTSSEITEFNTENGLSDNHIRMTLELSDGSIAVATQNGINIIKDDKVIKTYTDRDGLSNPIILCLCEGKDGTLYAGSDGYGIYQIKNGTVTHYGADEGLPSGVILRMANDPDSDGIYISAGNSLYYWDGKIFKQFTNYMKSPGSIFDIQFHNDEIWLMQSNGINILNKSSLDKGFNTTVRILGSSYGLTGTLNANTWNDTKDNHLLLATSNGVSILDINDLNGENQHILVALNSVEVDGEKINSTSDNASPLHIDGSAARVTFDFSPLSYSKKDVMVQYQLKGFDKEFTVMHNSNPMNVSYTNLKGGNYEFCLQVLDSYGKDVVGSLSISLKKDYQIWEKTWFWVVMILVFILVIVAIAVCVMRIKTEALKRRQKEYRRIIDQSLRTFANIIDAKDKYTNGHSLRVATYSLELAKKLKLSAEEQERIYDIALLHDIGKIGIPDGILNKEGKLTEKEIQTIKRHPTIGGKILKDFTSIPGISDGARYHHERYDGKGYNKGLSGKVIPFFARIICVADCYDTMAGGRHYQAKKTQEEIKEELKRCSGTQFDPEIAKLMIELIDEGKAPISFEGNSFRSFFEEEG